MKPISWARLKNTELKSHETYQKDLLKHEGNPFFMQRFRIKKCPLVGLFLFDLFLHARHMNVTAK